MKNFNALGSNSKLAVLDQDASVDSIFLPDIFLYNVGKVLITRKGKTVASLVEESNIAGPDQPAAGRVVILPYSFFFGMRPHGLLSGLVRMATEGEVTLAIETEFDGSKHLLLTPSTEKFNPHCEHVIVLNAENQIDMGYQLYRADPAVGQKVMGEEILDYDGYVRKQMQRMCE